jgi:hypothetical protein
MDRFGHLALVLFAGVAIFSAAKDTLVQVLPDSDVRRMAAVIELNATHRQRLVDRGEKIDDSVWIDPTTLDRVAHSAMLQQAADGCLGDASRAATSVQIGVLNQALLSEASDRQLRAIGGRTGRIVAERLRCAPTDGNAWLLRARLVDFQTADTSSIGRLLDLSYLYAPSEEWVMVPRLRFVGYMIDTGQMVPPPQYGLDLERFIGLRNSSDVASLYADSGDVSRGIMRSFIDGQRLDRRVQIVRRIDSFGVFYPVPEACRPNTSNGLPGSELEMRRPADLIEACTK